MLALVLLGCLRNEPLPPGVCNNDAQCPGGETCRWYHSGQRCGATCVTTDDCKDGWYCCDEWADSGESDPACDRSTYDLCLQVGGQEVTE